MQKSKSLFLAGVLIVFCLAAGFVSAATPNSQKNPAGAKSPKLNAINNIGQSINGSVLSVSGTTLTVEKKSGKASYTVDASKSKITKGPGANATTLNVSDIKKGDMVKVSGEIKGTSIMATSIMISIPIVPRTQGNVTAVNGASFTIDRIGGGAGTQSASYTVNSTELTIFKQQGQPATISDVAVGKRVMIQGNVDDSTNIISATSINIFAAGQQTNQAMGNKKLKGNKPGSANAGPNTNTSNGFDFGASISKGVFSAFGKMGDLLKSIWPFK